MERHKCSALPETRCIGEEEIFSHSFLLINLYRLSVIYHPSSFLTQFNPVFSLEHSIHTFIRSVEIFPPDFVFHNFPYSQQPLFSCCYLFKVVSATTTISTTLTAISFVHNHSQFLSSSPFFLILFSFFFSVLTNSPLRD